MYFLIYCMYGFSSFSAPFDLSFLHKLPLSLLFLNHSFWFTSISFCSFERMFAGDRGGVHPPAPSTSFCPWSHIIHREQVQNQRQQHPLSLQVRLSFFFFLLFLYHYSYIFFSFQIHLQLFRTNFKHFLVTKIFLHSGRTEMGLLQRLTTICCDIIAMKTSS